MKRFLPLLLLTLLSSATLYSQFGNRQAGVRTGYSSGFFIQTVDKAGSAEIGYNAMLTFRNYGLQVTGLRIVYEASLENISPDLYFCWGYGAHAGFTITDHLRSLGQEYTFEHYRFCPLFGVDGLIGAEYRFRDIPLIISINVKPFVEITIPAMVDIMPADVGISVSYVF